MGNVNELFDNATEESFFIEEEGNTKDKKTTNNKQFTPIVEGNYLGHIIEVETRLVDVKNWKARLYNYTVQVHKDNSFNKYTLYGEHISGKEYVGLKFRGNVWRFLEPKESDSFESNANGNKGYLMHCETIGIECPTQKKEVNGKEVTVKMLPNLNTNDMLGVPVTAVVKKGKPFTNKNGERKQYFDCKWVERWKDGVKIDVEGDKDEKIPF